MADPFVAEIRIFPFNFAPTGWAFCDGQLMPISQNTALFSLVGTFYGGDGKSTFALPDLQGAAPLHAGQGQGLSLYDLGQVGGVDNVTLLQSEIPVHTHQFRVSSSSSEASDPTGSALARVIPRIYGDNLPFNTSLNAQSVNIAGGSLPHNNMQPYLTLNLCIALQGVFPQRP